MLKMLSNTLSNPLPGSMRYRLQLLHSQDMFLLTSVLSQDIPRSACFSNLFSMFLTFYVKNIWKVFILSSHCLYFVIDSLFYVVKEWGKKNELRPYFRTRLHVALRSSFLLKVSLFLEKYFGDLLRKLHLFLKSVRLG